MTKNGRKPHFIYVKRNHLYAKLQLLLIGIQTNKSLGTCVFFSFSFFLMEILILSSMLSWESFIQCILEFELDRNEMLGRRPYSDCILSDAVALVLLRNVTFLIKPEKKKITTIIRLLINYCLKLFGLLFLSPHPHFKTSLSNVQK